MDMTPETLRQAGAVADAIEDGTLFRSRACRRAEHAETVRAVIRELQRLEAARLTLIDQQSRLSLRNVELQAEVDRLRAEAGGPPAAQAYRMLRPNVDIIRPDDEYLSDDTTRWEPVGRCIFVGMHHVHGFKPGRRRIDQAEGCTVP